ncbi:peptidylprolyl isomerase [Nakamurella sp. PAMC28650]|uniref:peptidylprolyl isomerase n=1 Tax=Nakamurella sp. PAMC28650 TaxID=2762325 RepID=UPI001C9B4744|nr:peptidylprolyl isomerase [Nakamurella sp. PAMC28650]
MTVPSNQQRREAAKRKLERQLVRREERERGRRQRLVIVGVVATVLVIGGGIWFATTRGSGSGAASTASGTGTETAATSPAAPKTPCTYTTAGKAAKKVDKPSNLSPANTGTVASTITLNGQKVDITLDRAAAPCTVNSFVSLASQKFYDNSPCWRLTGNSALNILQCGDPTGVGNGGPGYSFADELGKTKTYPRGTIAMANSGSGTNGSQFFIVYKDSTLSPTYTVFGKVSDAGMAVIQDIAAKGSRNNSQDGAPVAKAVIDSVTVPSDALSATGTYATASSAAASAAVVPTGGATVKPTAASSK